MRSGFFGAVVQLTHALADDVVKTLTSEVIVALVYTPQPVCSFLGHKDMSFQHHASDGIFASTLLSVQFPGNVTHHKQREDQIHTCRKRKPLARF